MALIKDVTRTPSLPDSHIPLRPQPVSEAAAALAEFIRRYPRLFVLTGAGVSTDSGIPDYRDGEGAWKRGQPVQHQDFMSSETTRRRYWGRSLIGWPVIRNARPNPAHFQVAALEGLGLTTQVVTQNVDRLHQRAGTRDVVDLHGRADQTVCMNCGFQCSRDEVHDRCHDLNPHFRHFTAEAAPDGDAELEVDFRSFELANCPLCDGILKPDVVFFGDNVPRPRVASALEALKDSDGLLVIGSSLMVYSGFRFCRQAREWDKPIATLNLGRTRADPLVDLKLNARIAETLSETLSQLRR